MKKLVNLMLVLLVGTLSVLSAQGSQESANLTPETEDAIEITVVYHDTGIEFGQVIRTGAMAAAEEFGIKVNWVGPIGIDVNEQVNFIENAITSEVDGLAVSNVNAEALNPVIDKAIDAGIPTVTFNSEAAGSKRLAFYGQDLVESGYIQGQILVEYMGEEGKVIITSGDASASWSQDRESGVRKALDKYPGIEIVQVLSTGWEDQQMYAAIENALLANPDLTGMASLGAPTSMATGRALLRNDKYDKIMHVCHDLMPETLDNVKAGATKATLSQNPFMQGYLPVKNLYLHLSEGKELQSEDTGILRVDSTNVDEYLQKLENGEPIG
ncbi:MAG: sugar ABC transporter substrate-binding protein [Spirochaetia bacterium]|nr:sugar ABC transporter substrate-binding protein [Spirochaetia bacterium]MCF7945551.1 sugar ABC transporter substrate-binding protein [Spirochaetia bacterium]MCF7946879.1 sugar ABC transporter substrate-binding protein [Spirochaetia bacterium]